MKTLKKVLVFAMMLAMLAALGVSASAYELRVYAGNCGNFDGSSYTQVEGANSNYAPAVTVTDSKYFAKGYAVAGHNSYDYYGNPTYSASINFQNDKDIDYVVVYGVSATSISYTVRYVTAAGTEVKESQTYSANAGDNVTMVIPYVDGYEAVSANGVALTSGIYYIQFSPTAGATYDIVYQVPTTPAAATTTTTTTTTTTSGTTASSGSSAGNSAAANPAASPAAGNDAAEADTDSANTDNTEVIEENTTPQAQPETEPNEDNTVVIDENETPGGNFTQSEVEVDNDASHLAVGTRIVILCAGIVVIGTCVFFIVWTLRKKKG